MDAHEDLVHDSFPKEGSSLFPTFGLEPGGSLDRSVAKNKIQADYILGQQRPTKEQDKDYRELSDKFRGKK